MNIRTIVVPGFLKYAGCSQLPGPVHYTATEKMQSDVPDHLNKSV